MTAATSRKSAAPNAASVHSRLGSRTVCATSTITVAGSTMRSGTIRCSMSIAEIATSTQQKKAAIAA